MKYEYCKTCKKISPGGFFPSADREIKIFHCRICDAITCMESKSYEFKFFEYDIQLRNEANKLQIQYFKKLNKAQKL